MVSNLETCRETWKRYADRVRKGELYLNTHDNLSDFRKEYLQRTLEELKIIRSHLYRMYIVLKESPTILQKEPEKTAKAIRASACLELNWVKNLTDRERNAAAEISEVVHVEFQQTVTREASTRNLSELNSLPFMDRYIAVQSDCWANTLMYLEIKERFIRALPDLLKEKTGA